MPVPSLGTAEELATLSGHRHTPPLLRYTPSADRPPLWSASATWRDVTERWGTLTPLHLPAGWTSAWNLTYRNGEGEEIETPVSDAGPGELFDSLPVRTATWHPNARARAGLHYVACIDDHRFHESLFERNFLTALDFHGVNRIASQPFTLTWHDDNGEHRHTPDFLVEAERTVTVVNIRPKALVTQDLLRDCVAVETLCLSLGWRHALVTGYPRPSFINLAEIGSQRSAEDNFGYSDEILGALSDQGGPMGFANLADIFEAPVIARAIIMRLIWDRELSINLNQLLGDNTAVALAGEEPTP